MRLCPQPTVRVQVNTFVCVFVRVLTFSAINIDVSCFISGHWIHYSSLVRINNQEATLIIKLLCFVYY